MPRTKAPTKPPTPRWTGTMTPDEVSDARGLIALIDAELSEWNDHNANAHRYLLRSASKMLGAALFSAATPAAADDYDGAVEAGTLAAGVHLGYGDKKPVDRPKARVTDKCPTTGKRHRYDAKTGTCACGAQKRGTTAPPAVDQRQAELPQG